MFAAQHIFDGGDMDCGSGLTLLIRQQMLLTPQDGIMELRSQEPTVTAELPPWCRMVGHEYLGSEEPSPGHWRHFLRRKNTETAAEMATDMSQARSYTWRLRARSTGMREATLYARNFSWQLGQPASFEEKDAHPSAIEAALGALAADVLNGFASICAQKDCPLDELEVNTKATLHDVMAHLGLSTGDPSMASVDLTLFVTAAAPGATIRAIWEEAKRRSPLYNTFKKALALDSRLVLM